MNNFYADSLRRLLEDGWIGLDSNVLVVCGGRPDRDCFFDLGFRRVTVSNLDVRMTGDEFAPYPWSMQNAENLNFADGEFDFVVVHQGLHHCYSPHRGLLEMYRVARRGVLVFEPRDTPLVRLGVKLGFGQEFEVAAVAEHGLKFGGAGNNATPNFVYRWTEREIEKTISAGGPTGRARFRYFFALRLPKERIQSMKNRQLARTMSLLLPVARLFALIFPKQSNCFAFAITKPEAPDDLHPWMVVRNGQIEMNQEWVKERYTIGCS